MPKPHIVIVILEAKLGKENELAQALKKVVEPSRAEETCVEYRLHQDSDNPTQFVLYEQWVSRERHQEQFTKPYIMELGQKINDLLAKPYQAIFATEMV